MNIDQLMALIKLFISDITWIILKYKINNEIIHKNLEILYKIISYYVKNINSNENWSVPNLFAKLAKIMMI